jgi:uncharacterized protein
MAEKQTFLYQLRPTRIEMLTDGGTTHENETVSTHFNYLKDLTAAGTALFVGRTLNADATTFGIAVFQAEDEAEAQSIMQNDPAVVHGVMTATLFPFRISLVGDLSRA